MPFDSAPWQDRPDPEPVRFHLPAVVTASLLMWGIGIATALTLWRRG